MPRDRTLEAVAAIVFFLLVLCLALTSWQWRAARVDAAAAQAQSERTAATRDFLAQLLRTAAGTSATEPAQHARMKDVLDAATPRVAHAFADDARGQAEMLGLLASMYREIGEYDSRRALLSLQRTHLRRVHGDAHPVLIRSLLDEAESEIARGDTAAAAARLAEADPLITRAGQDDGALRAQWWMLLSDSQPDGLAGTEALDRAIAGLERERSPDARLGEALERKARRLLSSQPAQAEALFARAVALAGEDTGALRREALAGLAEAHEAQGEYEAALAALESARTPDAREPAGDAHLAWTLHREGLRARALSAFEALVPNPASSGPAAEAVARTFYAACLAAEGRPMQAIPLLEAVHARADEAGADAPDRAHTLLALGDAYDRAGLWWKARDTLKASLDQHSLRPEAAAGLAEVRERWGRFLLGRGELEDAQAQFDLVLDQGAGRNIERVVLAYGGLARVALARRDWDAALTASTHAVVGFENIVGPRDVRTGPYLWLIHAEALRSVDDFASARIWATRALDASRRYDAPDAASIRDAQAMLARLLD